MLLPIALASLLYASMLALVLVWTGWSVKKHGWCRRSLRRFSYLIFLMLLAVRLAWCGVLFAYLAERPNLQMHALRSTTAVALDHAAFILHFLAFSMLVCGWADSTMMMMSGRSLQPAVQRSPTIFYHIGGAFIAVNVLNALVAGGTLLPLFLVERGDDPLRPHAGMMPTATPPEIRLAPGGSGYFGDNRQWSNEPIVGFALWMSSLSAGLFSLLLALSSTVAGALVSCKIRNIADVEPALRSYAHQKMIKVALAACVFSTCSLSRAYVLLREALMPEAPALYPLTYLTFGVEVPELLPTLAALLVLRRRPISYSTCCSPWSATSVWAQLTKWVGGLGRREVTGVDRTPLTNGASHDSEEAAAAAPFGAGV